MQATWGLNFGFQGVPVYGYLLPPQKVRALSTSVYVHSIPNNNDNQDIVSMGTNSAVIAKQVLKNAFQVMAIHIMAICQAIDLLHPEEKELVAERAIRLHADSSESRFL